MSKFQILPKGVAEEKVNGSTLYGTGINPTAVQKDQLTFKLSNGRKRYITGLSKDMIDKNMFLSPEEKERYKAEFDEDYAKISTILTPTDLDEFNEDFWGSRMLMELDSGIASKLFDTEASIDHALIKWGIISNSYSCVAPSLDACNSRGTEYYMVSVEEKEQADEKKSVNKLAVYSKISDLVDKADKTQLLWFAWALDKTTEGFTETTAKSVIIDQITEYVEGKLSKGTAKKKVLEKTDELLALYSKNKSEVILRGVFKAALHYGLIYTKDGSFMTADRRTKLKATEEDSLELLKDPNLREELTEIKAEVEKTLKGK